MPKHIENLREALVTEARRQVLESGYSAMTIRSVAKKCGVAVGTVYNYFESKDALTAEFMLEDWQICRAEIEEQCENVHDDRSMLSVITESLEKFCREHEQLFSDPDARSSYISVSSGKHTLFRDEIADMVAFFCKAVSPSSFTAKLVAEGIIMSIRERLTAEEIYPPLLTLIRNCDSQNE